MTPQRTIEIFSAGCPLCTDTLETVRKAVADCGCRVVERPCTDAETYREAENHGIRSMPTIVIDGQIIFEGRPSLEQAVALFRR